VRLCGFVMSEKKHGLALRGLGLNNFSNRRVPSAHQRCMMLRVRANFAVELLQDHAPVALVLGLRDPFRAVTAVEKRFLAHNSTPLNYLIPCRSRHGFAGMASEMVRTGRTSGLSPVRGGVLQVLKWGSKVEGSHGSTQPTADPRGFHARNVIGAPHFLQ
jgi:hypothetical protein